MSDKTELLPCPFCGGDAASDAHAEDCYFSVTEAFKAKAMKNADMSLAPAVLRAWNRRAALTQQPAQAVPDGWKLVPVDPTEEILDAISLAKNMTRRGLAVVMNMQELESIYRAMLAAAPAAPVAQEPVAIEVMQFQLKHPDSGETHTVELTRGEVADGMEDTLYEKLSPMVCQCNGDADHECGDYIHDFDLVADPPAAEQPTRAKQALATISRMARNEACRSGAPAAGQLCTWGAIADMADAVTAEQPDTVKMPRDLAERCKALAAYEDSESTLWKELRALLDGGEA